MRLVIWWAVGLSAVVFFLFFFSLFSWLFCSYIVFCFFHRFLLSFVDCTTPIICSVWNGKFAKKGVSVSIVVSFLPCSTSFELQLHVWYRIGLFIKWPFLLESRPLLDHFFGNLEITHKRSNFNFPYHLYLRNTLWAEALIWSRAFPFRINTIGTKEHCPKQKDHNSDKCEHEWLGWGMRLLSNPGFHGHACTFLRKTTAVAVSVFGCHGEGNLS